MNKLKKRLEILAPCGGKDSVYAAVNCGANAVYVGAQNFSARASAKNFSYEDLEWTVNYCHSRDVLVYLAINTLITDAQLDEALEVVKKACLLHIDAFIVQDVGFANLIQKLAPHATIHASTQMSIHTPKGAELLYNNGFKRIVLSRELTKSQIQEITSVCKAEFEVFVHGALCMSVSGQCYLSAFLGGRSGNKGMCAQPCRLPFEVKGGTKNDLSLKDLSILENLQELENIGVASAKIEGRMKRPEYVASATRAAKEFLESGTANEQTLTNLNSVFSRSGFTNGYYTGKTGKNMFGTRQKENVTVATNKLMNGIKNTYKSELQKLAITMSFCLKENEPSKLTVTDENNLSVTVYGRMPEVAINLPLSKEKASLQLQKTGGTPFFVKDIDCNILGNITLQLSELNQIRREALALLLKKKGTAVPIVFYDKKLKQPLPHKNNANPSIRAVFIDTKVPISYKECEKIFIPLFSKDEEIIRLINEGFNVGVTLPRGMFGIENKIYDRLLNLKKLGINDALTGNLGGLPLISDAKMQAYGDFGLNVFNTESLKFLELQGLKDSIVSFELTTRQINAMGANIKRGAVVYGYLPLMLTRNCPAKNSSNSCKSCGANAKITDRKNIDFSIVCEQTCSELLNSVPLYMGDKLDSFNNIDFYVLRLTKECVKEREKILELIKNKQPFGSHFTRGLYEKGIQTK